MNIQDKIERESRSLVLVGDFNPLIFTPMWFSHYGLIGEKEAEDAKVKIVHKDVVIFELDWITIEVTRQQFIAMTNKTAYYQFAKDLIAGTFSLLSHTPIIRMGINLEVIYSFYDKNIKNELEKKLYPYDIINKDFNSPTFNKIVFTQERLNSFKGFTRVTVEPSEKANTGMLFAINDHFEVNDIKETIGCSDIMKIFTEQWDDSYKNSLEIINKLKSI